MYSTGQGVPQDYVLAHMWYNLAAEQGHASAQASLGSNYYFGEGVPQDRAEAVRWYRLAADQGEASAQAALGIMYDTGDGVPENDAEAVRWYRLAGEQGFVIAQNNLGHMYFAGRGSVPQDYVQAHMCFNLAASRSSGEAREDSVKRLDVVANLMTPDALNEAPRLAREWTAAHPRDP